MFENSPTPDAIKKAIFERLDPSISTINGSYTYTLVSAVALEIWKLSQALEVVPSCLSLTIESPQEIILACCKDVGIVPKAGSRAMATLRVMGLDGTVIAKGKQFLETTGRVYNAVRQTTIEGGSATFEVEAEEVGGHCNQPAHRIIIQMEAQAGITEVTSGAATGGTDSESLESLLGRYHLYLQKPATSANANQYKLWALSVDGVGDALICPLAAGPGTVGVMLASPERLPVDATVVARCKAYIDTQRPADAADVLVSSAKSMAIQVSAALRVATSTTLATVARQFKEQLTVYCREWVAFANDNPPYTTELPYAKVGYILLGLDGVEDYSGLTVNGGTVNITMAAGELPVVGEVLLT